MRLLKSSVLLGLLLAALAWPASALAGGWSVVVADPLPPDITADANTTIGFTVLQHGRLPLSGQSPKIEAIHESGERVTATATAPERRATTSPPSASRSRAPGRGRSTSLKGPT